MFLPIPENQNKETNLTLQIQKGECHANQGNLYEAMSHILEALRIDPLNSQALNDMGIICWKLYRSGKSFGGMALEYITNSIRLDPNNRQTIFNLAKMCHNIYQGYNAKKICEDWLKNHPDDREMKNFYDEICYSPTICNEERLRLHDIHFDSDNNLMDQFGVFVGSTKYKLAYLVINKCACSTFRNWILAMDYQGNGGPLNNMISKYDNDFTLFSPKKESLPEYFKFSFVRNPYWRVLSFYTDRILNDHKETFFNNEAPQYKNVFRAGMLFDDFVKKLSVFPVEDFEQHLAPQTYFLFSNNRLVVDFIGRLEKISKDVQFIKSYLNIEIPLPHKRKTTDSEHKKLYSKESASLIYRKYLVDFDFLGYKADSWKV